MNLFAIFLTGLTTGGLTCVAMQGGLLASVIATQKGRELEQKADGRRTLDAADVLPVGMFLGAKLLSHTLLGFGLGALGSVLELSLEVKLGFQFLAALFLFATAMNLLEVHPVFRFVAFQPPKFVQRFIRGSAKNEALFAPAVLGFFTFLIPCGVTQAMEVIAITSGQPLTGAAIMFSFVLGTFPLFSIIGVATARMSEIWNTRFLKAAALALIVMAINSVNGVLTVLDAPLTLGKIQEGIMSFGEPPDWYSQSNGRAVVAANGLAPVVDGVQQVRIDVTSEGYDPRYIKVRRGVPVKLDIASQDAFSCASSFVFKKFNIVEQLQPTDRKTITFTPQETGKFPYTCAMGMFTGTMEVI